MKKIIYTLIFSFVFFLFTENVSAVNTCCTYYKGAAKSDQCYDIAIAPTAGTEFACSAEADATKKYSANLAGGYTVDTSVESSCITVPGYVEENILPSNAVCGYAKALNGAEFLGKLADAKVALVQTSAAEVAKGFCCIAVGTAGSCSTPTLKTTILSQVKNAVLGVGMQSLLPLPKTADEKKGYNLLSYFDCPAGTQYYFASCSDTTPLPEADAQKYIGGAANLNNYSLANYCAIKDQVPYYCACKTDKTVCFPTKYSDKATCLAGAPKSDYECANLEKGKTDCAMLAVNKPLGSAPKAPTAEETKGYLEGKYPVPVGGSNFLPDCAYPGTCDDVNDLLILLINVAKFLFKIIGTAAFAFFVYGGFTMVLSMGSADKVKSGRETLVAAVIGLIIAFSAYVLVDVVLDILQVSNDYRNVGSLETKK